jgi:hypothetical protein
VPEVSNKNDQIVYNNGWFYQRNYKKKKM